MALGRPPSANSVFARSFLIQGSWNYRTMQGTGFAFALLPALRHIFRDRPSELDAAVRRHAEHFNAHPYMSGLALGAVLHLENDGVDGDEVQRFKTAVRGPLGGLGDALVWASWLPAVSMAALALLWLGAPGWIAVATFLVVYNVGHIGLRIWGFRAGLAEGRRIGRSLSRAHLAELTEKVRAAAALLLGILGAVVIAREGELGEPGLTWGLLAASGFVLGDLLGHRLWRPTAIAIVVVVISFAAWGWAS
jgi:PTS system mannose-specific IID component